MIAEFMVALLGGEAGSLVLEVFFKATLLLALAALASHALRRGSASVRHLIWSAAIAGALALPVLTLWQPVSLAVVPTWGVPEAPVAEPVAFEAVRSSPASDNEIAAPIAAPEEQGVAQVAAAQTEAVPSEPVLQITPARVGAFLGFLWVAVAALLLGRFLLGVATVWFLARLSSPVGDASWQELLSSAARRSGVRQPVKLLVSDWTTMPMTWGVVRPVVMLPRTAEKWTDERREVVLLHELAHIRRRDVMTLAVAQLACALYWFNPLMWVAAARQRAEAERACDDFVLAAGTRASTYADHLLDMVRAVGRARVPATAALPMARRSGFEGRLLAILEPGAARGAVRRGVVTALGAVCAIFVVALAGMGTVGATELSNDASADAEYAIESPAADADAETAEYPGPASSSDIDVASVAPLADGMSALKSAVSTAIAPEAFKALITGMDDGDSGVRADVAESLAQLQDPRAIAALARALREDENVEVRRTAAWALGQIEEEAAVAPLAEALAGDRDTEVRRTAAWALGNIESPSGVAALTTAMRDSDAEVRASAIWALGQIEHPSAVAPLTVALRDDNAEIRKNAAWALGQIEDASAVDALAVALRDNDAEVRSQAVWALGQIESAAAVGPLTAMIDDRNVDVRRQVIWALGQIESASAVDAVARVLRNDDDAEVRQQAAWALGQIESTAAMDALSAALADPIGSVRTTAAWAIGQVEPATAPDALIDAALNGDSELQQSALWALSQIEDRSIGDRLAPLLRAENVSVRRSAIMLMARSGSPAGVEALAEMMRDPDPAVRQMAAQALAGRGHWASPNPQPRPQPQPRPAPRPRPVP